MATKFDWAMYETQEKRVVNKISESSGNAISASEGVGNSGQDEAPDHFSPAEVSLLQKIIRKSLFESKCDIEAQRSDPNSPFYSVNTFEALHLKPNLLKGVYEMGFNAPSKIQEMALPTLLSDPPQNLIAQSQSGTGKTAVFVLAMLTRVDPDKHYPQVLCLSPTYELAIQTGEVAAHMSKFCPEIELKYAVRGEEMPRGTKVTEHIIIGVAGKVLEWGIKYCAFDLSKITVFVLDEADVMIASEVYQDQCLQIHKCLDRKCQMMFFSTTYDQEFFEFAEVIVPNPLIIRLRREEESLDNIQQYYVKCANKQEKYDIVTNIYGTVGEGQSIIFCKTRRAANWLSEKMMRDGHAIAVLTSDLTVDQRIAVLDRFRNGQEKVLITTNILSRGIDIEQVTIVVNYDLPLDVNGKPDCKTYLHRIGRTGRFGKRGIAINLIDSPEAMLICQSIEKYFNQKIIFLNTDNFNTEMDKVST